MSEFLYGTVLFVTLKMAEEEHAKMVTAVQSASLHLLLPPVSRAPNYRPAAPAEKSDYASKKCLTIIAGI